MKKMIQIALILLLTLPVFAGEIPDPTDYWLKIRKIASKEFGGLELNPVLKTG